jgi:hypothetical protein
MVLDTLVTKQASITLTKSKNKIRNGEKANTKNQIAIDTKNQVILAHRVVKGPKHDSKDVIPLIRKIKKFNLTGFILDKVY